MPNLFPPKVTVNTKTVELGKFIAFSELFSVADLDADSEVKLIRVRDGNSAIESSQIVFGGVVQTANTWLEFDYSQIHKLFYKSAFVVANEAFSVQVYDGKFWSEVADGRLFTVRGNLEPPVLTASSFSILSTEGFRVLDAIEATDSDGYPMTKYLVVDRSWNSNGGQFRLRDTVLASATWHEIAAEDMPFLRYIGGKFGQVEKVAFQSFDGRFWSNIAEASATTTPNLFRPVADAINFNVAVGASILVSNLFNYSDPDGNTVKKLQIFDTGFLGTGGFFSVNAVQIAAGSWFTVQQKDFGNFRYNAAQQFDQERFRIRTFDGQFWSSNSSGLLQTISKPSFFVDRTVVVDELESVAVNGLITPNGGGAPITKYEFIDLNEGALSGRLTLGGSSMAANVVHSVTAAQFNTLSFVGGSSDNGREFDRVAFRASNGTNSWNNWSFIDFNTDAVGADAVDLGPGIHWATGAGTTTITYTFIDRLPFYYPDDSDEFNGNPNPLTLEQKTQVREALEMFETMIDVDFVETTNSNIGDITFGLVDTNQGTLGYAYLPLDPAFPPIFPAQEISGDVWFGQNEQDIIDANAEFYLTVIHEIGHAIGLDHPFEGNGILPAATENQRYSMMSYTRPTGVGPEQRDITPMLYDLVALQDDYGPNLNFNSGHDQIRLPINFNQFQIIWDGGGTDTFNLSNHTTNNVIDLRQGRLSSVGGVTDNVTLAYGTIVEYARGGTGDDTIFGNDLDNFIWGNNGNDIIEGLGGTDLLRAGRGNDKYIVRQGGGWDRIDEESLAGRDVLDIHGFGGFDDLDDLSFRRLGRDLRIDLTVDGGPSLGGVTVTNMAWGGSRVESMQLFATDDSEITELVDLKAIFDQSTDSHQRFRLTEFNSSFGIIAVPV